ncbi:MAG: ATP-binding protein, partial [Spirochaetota bacterium]|nr:ATP-binding protein [Spirochaetota bacterium]
LALHVRLTPLGVIEWDKNFRVKEWNAAAEKIFGYSKEEALDKHPTDIILPEAVRDIVNQIWEALLNQKGGTRSTNDNLTKQGNTIVCDWYNTPLINDEGQVFGVTSVVQDVTESIKMNKDLKEAKILADKANQAKSEFLANMSHEIRTPMNAILGFTEILNARLKDPVEKDYLDSIASSGKTLLRLINDILDLSKVEAGRIELEYSEVDIKSILHDIKQIFSQSAKAKSLKLEVFPGADMPELISLDEIRLRQILLNLVGNAIKFTQSGSVIISANAFKTDKSDKSFDIEITVTDTGIGISADKIDTIFDSFVQIKDQNRHFEGTGLGLTISNKLIKLMGGSISVQSVLNQGTSFIIKIPDVLWVDPAFSDTPLLPDIQSNMLFSPASILVVDDIENNRKVLKGFLEDYPFTILEAINGQSAVETAKLEIPDLIIMDLKMPVLDGYEATLIIKEHPETKHIPIVVASASSMRSQKEKIEPYIDGFVRKPFNKTDILLNISKLLPFSPKPASQSQNIPNPPDLSENINNISKQDYIELNNNLDGSLIEKWSEISQTLEFKEIGKFAHSVNEVAKDLGYIPVVKWSEKLISATKLFHVDIIKSLMSDFSLLLNHVHGRDIDISKNVKSEELK